MGEVESITASSAKFRKEKFNALQKVTECAIWIAYPHAFSSRQVFVVRGRGFLLLGNGDPSSAKVAKEHLA